MGFHQVHCAYIIDSSLVFFGITECVISGSLILVPSLGLFSYVFWSVLSNFSVVVFILFYYILFSYIF